MVLFVQYIQKYRQKCDGLRQNVEYDIDQLQCFSEYSSKHPLYYDPKRMRFVSTRICLRNGENRFKIVECY